MPKFEERDILVRDAHEHQVAASEEVRDAEALVRCVSEIVNNPHADKNQLLAQLARDSRLAGNSDAGRVVDAIWEIRLMVASLGRGDLHRPVLNCTALCGTLRTFQGKLRHLVWQARNITGGRVASRVESLGELGEAFNLMAAKLESCISHLTATRQKYHRLSNLDQLTGVGNRRAFMEAALSILNSAEYLGEEISLVMIDVDHFKSVNDTYGHVVGDAMLHGLGRRLKSCLRDGDICSRYGGEEFIILLPKISRQQALKRAEQLRRSIENMRIEFRGGTYSMTASFGVHTLSLVAGGNMDEVLKQAIAETDACLYKAKQNGRNIVCG